MRSATTDRWKQRGGAGAGLVSGSCGGSSLELRNWEKSCVTSQSSLQRDIDVCILEQLPQNRHFSELAPGFSGIVGTSPSLVGRPWLVQHRIKTLGPALAPGGSCVLYASLEIGHCRAMHSLVCSGLFIATATGWILVSPVLKHNASPAFRHPRTTPQHLLQKLRTNQQGQAAPSVAGLEWHQTRSQGSELGPRNSSNHFARIHQW